MTINNFKIFATHSITKAVSLWFSDGTAGGTFLITDLRLSNAAGTPVMVIDNGSGNLIFSWSDAALGGAIWFSNGYFSGSLNLSGNEISANTSVAINTLSVGALDTYPTPIGYQPSSNLNDAIVFIDSRVSNIDTLLAGFPSSTSVVILDSNQDGLAQIQTALAGHSNLAAIHIFSHGDIGTITLGTLTLNQANLTDYQTRLTEIGTHLSDTGDILLYGCNIAAGTGLAFIEQFATVTSADIAASTNITGSAALGGDWKLEATLGSVETNVILSTAGQNAYQGVLANSAPYAITGAAPSRVGTELLVNTAIVRDQSSPQTTALSNGGFVVTWEDYSIGIGGATGDTSGTAVKAQVFAATGTKVGTELLVNTATVGYQQVPQITALSNGGFVVTWNDGSWNNIGSLGVGGATGDSTGFAVKAQVFAATGIQVGTELLVNTATADNQSYPQITALSNGGFVVTWTDYSLGVGGATGDTSSTAVKAQVFAATGTKVGTELLVNTATASDQMNPQITALSNGGFVVTWQDGSLGVGGATGDTSATAVKAQVFGATGTKVGAELLVNTATASDQSFPQITALSNGGFVVTWDDNSQGVGGATGDTSSYAVKAQVFAATGTKVGTELLVNTATAGAQYSQQITALSNSGFVVTWIDYSLGVGGATGDTSSYAVKAQVFGATGTKVGTELLVNTATVGDQYNPQITALSNGGFVVTWQDLSLGVGGATGDTSGYAVKAQIYAWNGIPVPSNNAEDQPFIISQSDLLTGFIDIDGNALTVTNLLADHGQVAVNPNGSYTMTPDVNYNGLLTLSYAVSDGQGGNTPTSQTFSLAAVNDAPVLSGTPATLAAGSENVAYTVTATSLLQGFTDVDGDTLVVSGLTADHGTVTDNLNGTYTITPKVNGLLTLSYAVSDGHGGSTPTSQTLAVNGAPVLSGTPATLAAGTEDVPYTVTAASLLQGFTDVDGNTLSVSGLTADHGTVTANLAGTYTITPAANYNGVVSLSYNVIDGHGGITATNQTFNLVAVNDAPVLSGTPATLVAGTEDVAYTVTAASLLQGFTDVEGNTLAMSGLTANHGTVTANLDGTYTITPAANYNGVATLSYNVIDGQGGSTPTNQTFNLAAVNDAPVLSSTPATLAAGTEDVAYTVTAASLLQGFIDIDGNTLAVSGLTTNQGTVTANLDGTYTIIPAANYNGVVSLSYNVIDGQGGSTPTNQTLSLAAVNDAPVLSGTPATLAAGTEDVAYTVTATRLLQGFTDVDGDTLAVSGLTADHGTVTANLDGTYTLTPAANYNGVVSLSYAIIDGQGGSTPTNQTVSLAAVNDAPILSGTPATLAAGTEDVAYTVTATRLLQGFTDVDGNTLSVSGLTTDYGTVTDNLDGTYTITPEFNYNGVVTLSYAVIDGQGGSTPTNQTFNLAAVNDAPVLSGTPTALAAVSELLVNTATASDQLNPQITALSNGGFVVTWRDGSLGVGGATGDASAYAVKAQVFGATGTKVGAELLVNTATVNEQLNPEITALSNGGFVLTWQDGSLGVGGATGDTSGTAVKAQVFGATGTKVGAELLVNTATASDQLNPEITALSNGGFVVTWQDGSLGIGGATGDTSAYAVKAQVFGATGTKVGTELLVNTATASDQMNPQITALSNGGFVVTWQDGSLGVGGATGDSSAYAVKAQVFGAPGTKVGSELLVNTATDFLQDTPQITALSNGGFVVTWNDYSQGVGGATGDSSDIAVKAQVFGATGTKVGTELLVNTATASSQSDPQITALSNSGFVVTWIDYSLGVGGATGDTWSWAVKAQVFSAPGTKVGTELLVNTATASYQLNPQITALSNGGFVVTWEDLSQGIGGATGDSSDIAVKAQVFGATGTKVGTELLINMATASDQLNPQITALSNGGFVVTWQDGSLGIGGATGDASAYAVKAQVFSANGERIGALATLAAGSDDVAYTVTAASLLQGFTDVDGDTLAVSDITANHGTVTANLDGTYTITQEVKYAGIVTLSYAIRDGQGGSTPTSQAFSLVAVNDAPTGSVTITGTAIKGQILTAANNLADLDGMGAVTYTWFSNGVNTGLTGSNYSVRLADVGKVITAVANYTDGHGTFESVVSAPTVLVTALTSNLLPQLVSTTSAVGSQSLTTATYKGAINFSDANQTDVHTVSVKSTNTPLGLFKANLTESSGIGTVNWDYNYNKTSTFSASVVTRTDNFSVVINDGNGGVLTKNLSYTVITGTTAANTLTGGAGQDIMLGGAGNDILNGGTGNDILDGGVGNDIYLVDNSADVVLENINEGSDTIKSSISFDLGLTLNVENLTLTGTAAINGTGDAFANVITGNARDNTLTGGAGNDTLAGGAGNDLFIVNITGSGFLEDTISDSAGTDTIKVVGNYTGLSAITLTMLTSIENYDLSLTATSLLNLTGNAKSNTLMGNAANNVLNGGKGADTIIGGAGDDWLIGGAGNDKLTGGEGADTFWFNTAIGSNIDTVTDFISGVDKLQFSLSVLTALGISGQFTVNDERFYASVNGLAHDADDRLIYNTKTGVLSYDSNGIAAGGVTKLEVLGVTTHPTLVAEDIWVV